MDDSGNLEIPESRTMVSTTNTPPAAPTGIRASGGNQNVTIVWSTIAAATSYKVKRGTRSGGPYTTVGPSVTTSNYVDRAVTNGTTYYYVVSAVDLSGEGPNSTEATAVPQQPVANCTGCYTIWQSSTRPVTDDFTGDPSPVELGVLFRPDTDGYITGIRFYKGVGNTGTHIGNLWTAQGVQLASGVFSNETTSGWQQVNFATPVAVTANTAYVASYFAPRGNYARDTNCFLSQGVYSSPLYALADPEAGGNGVYSYSSTSTFPTDTSGDGPNYWVDVVFTTTVGTSLPAPQVTANASNGRVTLNWTFSGSGYTYNVGRSTTNGGPYTAIASGLTATRYVDSGLANGITYYYVVTSVNSSNQTATSTQASTTPAQPIGSCPACSTIWQTSTTPGIPNFADNAPVELGVTFQAASDGYVMGIRFYKGSGNTGAHLGNLWTTSGTRLATATFSSESPTG